jgi:outer membrane protein assembly factor BamB
VVIVCLLACAGSTWGEDWPTYRHDNTRSGATADRIVAPLTSGWTYRAPAAPRTAWSGPNRRTIEDHELRHRVRFDDALHVTVVGDEVFFGSSVDHQVRCLNARTGSVKWTFFTGGPVRLAPTLSGGTVLFGSDDGCVYCLDAATGSLLWKRRAGPADEWLLARGEMISRWPIRTGIMVEEGIAYFGAGIFPHEDVYLYAVRAQDGSIIWKRDNISESHAGRDDLSPQGHFLTSGNLLFVPSGRSLPAAFDRKSGNWLHKVRPGWRGDAGGTVGGTKALLADDQIYSGGAHHFVALSQQDGKTGFGYFEGRQMSVAGDDAYVANGSHVSRLARRDYAAASLLRHEARTILKKQRREQSKDLSEEQLQECLAAIAEAENVIAQSIGVGQLWQVSCPLDSALLLTNSLLFAGGENRVVAFDLTTGEEVWGAETEGEVRGLAAAGGRLYASTTSGAIHTFTSAELEAVATLDALRTPVSPYPDDKFPPLYAEAAEEILRQTGIRRGYCLVLGSEQGRLAYELAKRSGLKIYGVEPDKTKVAASRRALASANLYGHRVTVHHGSLAEIPFSNYFANLIVSDRFVLTGELPGNPEQIARHLKPVGGVLCFGRPAGAPGDSIPQEAIQNWLGATGLGAESTRQSDDRLVQLIRGKLPGAGDWTHLYGEPGNTASSEDHRIKGGLGVLWYGDPGPGEMVNRHDGAVGPLAVNGRMFVQGFDSVSGYDAYNGLFLWRRENSEALRTGVFENFNPGNLVASDESLFVMIQDRVVEFDAATGETKTTHRLPAELDDRTHVWGYMAYRDGRLFGAATIRKQLEEKLRRRGRTTKESTDTIFAIDTESGKHLWSYQGQNISHHTIALGTDRLFLIDSSLSSEERAALLNEDKTELAQLTGEEAQAAEEEIKKQDMRLAVAIDAQTGEEIWSESVDVTDCSEIGTGGGQLTMMYHNNVLVLCGANANGHYWKQFLAGEFADRRLVALSAEDGHQLWAKDANYRHRPIIVEDEIIAEPWGFDLYTGAQKMRTHPLTGQSVPWSMIRPGHHCGMLTGAPNMLMFRSGFTGFFDLEEDAGTRHFAGHRLGCWINAIPANGLVMIPEASAGCVCLFSIASTVVLEPRAARRPWTIYSAVGPTTPVERMALNLGGPGDRRDDSGIVWLAYPRPKTSKKTGLDLLLDLQAEFLEGGDYASQSDRSTRIEQAATPWLYTSAAQGLTRCKVPLLGPDDPASEYTVRLHFAELDDAVTPGDRVFDVALQGETVLAHLDVVAAADGPRKPLVREFKQIPVSGELTVELIPRTAETSAAQPPVLSAIELVRNGLAASPEAGAP